MTSTGTQLSLFDDSSTDQSESPALVEPIASSPTQAQAGVAPIDQARKSEVKLTPRSTLSAAMEAYLDHIQGSELSPHTVKSFMYDLNILAEFATPARPIGQIAQKDLENFLDWLLNGRGVPCKPKSLSRRVTTLKAFFRWLVEAGAIDDDPAAPIAHHPVSTPLPDILTNDQIDQVLAATTQLRHNAEKPDARPHLLVTLLLTTGIKKSECMALQLEHIDRSNPDEPALWIRYKDPRHFHKERKLRLDPKWPQVLDEYRAQYKIENTLFPCTARNLEYVLADIGKLAGLPKQLSFEMLRWTCAVQARRAGLAEEALRHKLGLSTITWHDTWPKIEKLASPAI